MNTPHVCGAILALAVLAPSQQPDIFASRVVSHDNMGQAGGGIFQPDNALGAPGGSTDVHSLGNGGHLVLGFDVTIVDGPGADLLVAENPFITSVSQSFAEMMFVEVSSNGTDFARIPNRYYGPDVHPGAFGVVNIGSYGGLAGAMPVRTGVTDPQDPVIAGGDAFDLADLQGDPLVVSGRVDLNAITQVRLVDVVDGVSTDSRGKVLRDPSDGSADVDAVTVIQHAGNQSTNGPTVELTIPQDGNFALTISDPDGILDLDPASWNVALWDQPISAGDLLGFGQVTNATDTSFTVRLGFSLPPGLMVHMTCSIKDRAGNLSCAMRSRPIN